MIVIQSRAEATSILVKTQTPYIACAVQNAQNHGLRICGAKIDIVATVYHQSQAGSDHVARDAAMSDQCDAFDMGAEARDEIAGHLRIAGFGDIVIDAVEIAPSALRDD